MDLILEIVPLHILIGLSCAMVLIVAEIVDLEARLSRLDKTRKTTPYRTSFMNDVRFFSENFEPKGEKTPALVDRIRKLRVRMTIFFILFSVLCLNIDMVSLIALNAQLSWTQNAIAGLIPAVLLTAYAEKLLDMISRG